VIGHGGVSAVFKATGLRDGQYIGGLSISKIVAQFGQAENYTLGPKARNQSGVMVGPARISCASPQSCCWNVRELARRYYRGRRKRDAFDIVRLHLGRHAPVRWPPGELNFRIGRRDYLADRAAYMWLAAAESWRLNEGQLVSRLPAFFLLFAQGALFLLRTPLGALKPHVAGAEPLFGSLWPIVLNCAPAICKKPWPIDSRHSGSARAHFKEPPSQPNAKRRLGRGTRPHAARNSIRMMSRPCSPSNDRAARSATQGAS
jgi:hypothetical protein